MTFGGAPSVFRLRQAQPTWNGRLGLVAFAVLAYTFAGFGVYWLKTGSGTVGEGGTVSNLGALIWMFPLVISFPAIAFMGDRGPLRGLYERRTTVTVGPDGLAWWTAKGGDGRLAWSELGGASRIRGTYNTYEPVFALSGEEAVTLAGPFKVEGRRKSVSLPSIILEARPKQFMPIDPRHPERGCLTLEPRSPDLR
jgi:hypothetical protein